MEHMSWANLFRSRPMPLIDAPDLLAVAAIINSLAQLVSVWRNRSGQAPSPGSPEALRPGMTDLSRSPPCRRDRVRPSRAHERK